MKYTKAEQDHLISELEKLTGDKPLFYLKFCSEKKFAEDVCNGLLYANTADYFRQKEIESGERGQGDQYELLSTLEFQDAVFEDAVTGEVYAVAPKGTMQIKFKEDDVVPIVSFVGIPLREMKLQYADDTHANFEFPFTEDEFKNMENKFGRYCVIINAKEIEQHVESYCKSHGCDYIFDRIEYCNQNRIDRMQAFNKCSKERFLYKNSDLSYQREYRLAVAQEIPVDHYIKIGKLENTKVFETKTLNNFRFSLTYTSHSRH